jgi:hypothetical protein
MSIKFLFFLFFILSIPSFISAETLYLKNGNTVEVSISWKESENTIGYYKKGERGAFYIDENEIDLIKTEQKQIEKAREEFNKSEPITRTDANEKKTVIDKKEENIIQGIKVFDSYKNRTYYLKWGMNKVEIEHTVHEYNLSFHSSKGSMKIEGVKGYDLFQKYADFGDNSHKFPVIIYFCMGKFCSYDVIFENEYFDFVYNTLKSFLGEPKDLNNDIVQNLMGAKFDQTTVTWETPLVNVYLEKRLSGDIKKGLFRMLYLPIIKPAKIPNKGTAPF